MTTDQAPGAKPGAWSRFRKVQDVSVLKMTARVVAILAVAILLTFGSVVMESAVNHVTTREGYDR